MFNLLILLLLNVSAFAVTEKNLTTPEIQKFMTCAAPMVSKWIQERGFAKESSSVYGPYTLTRTDVGDSGGKLTVKKNAAVLCDLPLDLTPEIFLSGKDQLMILSSYSGSSSWYTFYSLKGKKCELLGKTQGDEQAKEITKLLDEHNGTLTCVMKKES